MKAILKKVGEAPERIDIENALDALQQAVGGHIETVSYMLLSSRVVVICDEEGRIKGKPYNCTIGATSFCGDILIVGADEEDFADLPEAVGYFIIEAMSGRI